MGEKVALTDRQIEKLQKLVGVVADRFATCPDAAIAFVETATSDASMRGGNRTLGQFVADWQSVRLRRNDLLGIPAFRDPAWDMLIDLLIASEEGRQVSVTSLCHASGVPTTTALRHIDQLEGQGLIERTADSSDRRRVWIEASPETLRRMRELMARLRGTV